jgi:hypothetical protein
VTRKVVSVFVRFRAPLQAFNFKFTLQITKNDLYYETIFKSILVSLLSGATTLGAYKLLFDTNGYFSNNKNTLTTTAANSYIRG